MRGAGPPAKLVTVHRFSPPRLRRVPAPAPLATLAVAALLLGSIASHRAAADPDAGGLERIRALIGERRYAAAESLATAELAGLDHAPADSLRMADLMAQFVRSRTLRGAFHDSTARAMARRVIAIRTRRLGAADSAVADAHYALAYLYGPAGEMDSAEVHAQIALDIREQALQPGDSLISESLRLMGMVHRDRMDFAAAEDYFRRAWQQRLISGPEERPMVAVLLGEQGNCLRQMGRFEDARRALEHALAVYDRTLGRESLASASIYDYLAHVEREAGHLAQAIDLSLEAQRIARLHVPESHREFIRLQRNMSNWLVELGDYAGARAILERALPHYVAIFGAHHWRTLGTLLSLGIARAGCDDSTGAMQALQTVEREFMAKPGPPDPLVGTALLWQAELMATHGNHAGSLETARRAVPIEHASRTPKWLNLAELQICIVRDEVALGDTVGLEADRLELLRLADMRRSGGSNIPQTLRSTNALALSALRREREAWREALAADRISRERLRANVRQLPDRRALQLSLQYTPALDLVLALAPADSAGRLEAAWDALVRERGLVRSEVERRRLPPAARGDTALVRLHARWIDAERRQAQAIVGTADEADSLSREHLNRLREGAEDAERAWARAFAAHEGARRAAEPGFEEIRARLGAGQALVGCVLTPAAEDTAHVLALIARAGSGGIARVDLGRASALRAAIEPWRERLATSPGPGAKPDGRAERECRRYGARVRALTWDRIAPRIGAAREVFVVPDGPIADLDWQALPDGATRYLVETGPVLAVLNAERELLDTPPGGPPGALLAVGAPDYGVLPAPVPDAQRGAARLIGDPCSGGLPELPPLPGTATEVEAVVRTWPGRVDTLEGAAAGEAAFKRMAPGHEVLHVATHGVVARDTCAAATGGQRGVGGLEPVAAPRQPRVHAVAAGAPPSAPAHLQPPSPWLGRRVWLALAGANEARAHTEDENEGLLTAEEVQTLDLAGTDWVVLSACHSGLGRAWSREGTLGMRRAFHLAGARTVIASAWSVEDDATREWMDALYEARRRIGPDAARDVRAASRAVLQRRRAAQRSTHPFYWAAFDATGR